MFYQKKKRRGRAVLLVCALLIFAGFTYGYVSNNKPQIKPTPSDVSKLPEKDKIDKDGEKDTINKNTEESDTTNEVGQNDVEEPKHIVDTVNEDSNIILKTHYLKTGEIDTQKVRIPITIVGASLNEFKSYIESNYGEWNIRSVSTKSASLFKEVEGYKPNSFIVQSDEGYVAVFRINESGEKEVYEKTNISMSILSDADKRKMEEGITVRSLDDVYNIIEDYSS